MALKCAAVVIILDILIGSFFLSWVTREENLRPIKAIQCGFSRQTREKESLITSLRVCNYFAHHHPEKL
jgi:hypothetical protein